MITSRLEAFSDGVLAIIITIMVLELKVPEGDDLGALWEATGSGLFTYLVSFAYVGIHWNNHHHLFQLTQRISGGVLWANLHLLFWLSLLPFTTAWMDESGFASTPVMVYGIDLLGAAVAWFVLGTLIVGSGGDANAALAEALGRDIKTKVSAAMYLVGIAVVAVAGDEARWATVLAMGLFVAVAVIWLVPDRRLERVIVAPDAD